MGDKGTELEAYFKALWTVNRGAISEVRETAAVIGTWHHVLCEDWPTPRVAYPVFFCAVVDPETFIVGRYMDNNQFFPLVPVITGESFTEGCPEVHLLMMDSKGTTVHSTWQAK